MNELQLMCLTRVLFCQTRTVLDSQQATTAGLYSDYHHLITISHLSTCKLQARFSNPAAGIVNTLVINSPTAMHSVLRHVLDKIKSCLLM